MRGVTKEQIIKSVLDASFYKGASKISLSDVASGLGIKKASLYNHIESRDEMFANVFDYCEIFLGKLKFIPDDIETVASRYSSQTVLKGIMKRRFRMHQKPPLLQIYFFTQSQKYFDIRAQQIVKAQHERLALQIKEVLQVLSRCGKGKADTSELDAVATWFCAGSEELLCDVMVGMRGDILAHQEAGGKPFELHGNMPGILPDNLPVASEQLEQMGLLVERFCKLL